MFNPNIDYQNLLLDDWWKFLDETKELCQRGGAALDNYFNKTPNGELIIGYITATIYEKDFTIPLIAKLLKIKRYYNDDDPYRCVQILLLINDKEYVLSISSSMVNIQTTGYAALQKEIEKMLYHVHTSEGELIAAANYRWEYADTDKRHLYYSPFGEEVLLGTIVKYKENDTYRFVRCNGYSADNERNTFKLNAKNITEAKRETLQMLRNFATDKMEWAQKKRYALG